MEILIKGQAQSIDPEAGGITFDVILDSEDLKQLEGEAKRAFEIEQGLPADARTSFAHEDESVYRADFIKTRATNDALEYRNIIPVAIPHVSVSEATDDQPYVCTVHVHPRPDIGLTSLEPVDLATNRVVKPGFSAQAGRDGSGDVEFLEDEKVLRIAMVKRLDSELPESAMKALAEEYQNKFEADLAAHNIDPETYQLAHGLNEEQYNLMMARTALSDAHWNYALDAVFVGNGFTVTDEDLLATFELQCPGYSEQLLELHELRNDIYITVEKYRRGKALMWLKDNVMR